MKELTIETIEQSIIKALAKQKVWERNTALAAIRKQFKQDNIFKNLVGKRA